MKKRMFSLKKQILSATWLFMTVVGLLLCLLLYHMVQTWQQDQNETREENLQAYMQTLETNYSQLHRIVKEIYSGNSDFAGVGVYPSVAQRWNHLYNLMNLIRVQTKVNQGLSGLFVFYDSFEHMQYAVNPDISFEEVQLLKTEIREILLPSEQNPIDNVEASETEKWYSLFFKKNTAAVGGFISLTAGLPDTKESNAVYGVVYNGEFYQTWPINSEEADSDNSQTAEKIDFAALQAGRNMTEGKAVYYHKGNNVNLSVVEILPNNIWLYMNRLHLIFFMLIILFIFGMAWTQRFVYRELSRPLQDMTEALQNIQAGEWEVDFSAPNRITEIDDVKQSIRLLLAEVEHYKIRFYEEELEKARIHSQYLQIQLAPHFYTNCLKNAYYMLALKEYDQAEIFLQRLSVHLRYLLQQNRSFVRVREELDFVRNYEDMQKLMTSKPLSCEITVDESAQDKLIPIISIQTFVENSVKYARNVDGSLLQIQISVKDRNTEEGSFLDITVRDNGPGYPAELLDILNNGGDVGDNRMGIGVRNLLERLQVVYAGEQKPAWYFENRSGAVSELILPEYIEEIHDTENREDQIAAEVTK